MEQILNLDTQLFFLVNSLSGNRFLDATMLVLSSRELWIAASLAWIIFLCLKLKLKALKPITILMVVVGFTDAIAFQVLKPAFGRMRPCYALENVHLIQERCGGDFGFPSNHAANGGAVIAYVALLYRQNTFLLSLVLVTLVSFSRIYLGVHYPLDVLGGVAIGYVLSRFLLIIVFSLKKSPLIIDR